MSSMTGYGRAKGAGDGRELTVELKSVNHRFLDLSFRTPRACAFYEEDARRVLGEKLTRGRIDVSVQYRNLREDAREVLYDEGVAMAYVGALRGISKALALPEDGVKAQDIAALPDVFAVREREEDREAIAALFAKCLDEAIAALIASRKTEGERLAADIADKLKQLEEVVAFIAERAPQIGIEWRAKLTARMTELLGGTPVDPARVIQEAGLLAERACVDEELVRLSAHIASARDLLKRPATGKKLDFVVQEMNREMNTIGSKASDLALVQTVVEGKSLIEKIREQVQNLE